MDVVRDLAKIKILLVDGAIEQNRSEKLGGEGFLIKKVPYLKEALEVLKNQAFDIAILNLNAPTSKGNADIHTLVLEYCNLPILAIVADHQESIGQEAIRNGAVDYILESELDSNRLVTRLIQYVVEKNEHDHIKRDHERFLDLSRKVSKIGSWTWDPHTDVFIPTPTLLKIFGLHTTKNQFSLSEFLKILHVEDWEEIQNAFVQQAFIQESISLDFRTSKREDGRKHIFIKGKLSKDTSIDKTIYSGTAQDITGIRQISETLVQKNRFLELTGEIAAIGGWEFDLRTEELYWTSASYDIHDKPKDYKPTFENLKELYPIEYLNEMNEAFYKAIADRKNIFMEAPVNIQGTIKWLQYIGKLVFDGDEPVKITGIVYDISTNKRQIKKLELRAMMLDNIMEAAIALDMDYNIIFWNKAAEKMFGYSRSETLGKPITTFNLTEMSFEGVEKIFELLRMGENISDEYMMKDKSGRKFPAWASFSVVMDDDSQPEALLCMARDITEEKEHLKNIEDSELRFRRLFEYSPIGKGLVDLKTFKWIDANTTLVKLLGYSKEELLNLTPQEITPPEYSDLDLFHTEKLNRKGAFGPFQKEYYRGDGSRLKVIITGFVLNPKIAEKAWVHVLDITALDETTESLRKTEERFRDYVENSTDIILTIDEKGLIDYISPNIKKAMNYFDKEVIGRSFLSFIHPDDKRESWSIIRKAMENSDTELSITNRIRHKDGSYFYFQSEGKFRVSDNGKKSGIVISRNVDQAHRAELRVRKQNEILKDIAYIQSHILRRPLANILGLIALNNLTEPTSGNTFELFNLIEKEAVIMDEVVGEIVSKSSRIRKLSNNE